MEMDGPIFRQFPSRIPLEVKPDKISRESGSGLLASHIVDWKVGPDGSCNARKPLPPFPELELSPIFAGTQFSNP